MGKKNGLGQDMRTFMVHGTKFEVNSRSATGQFASCRLQMIIEVAYVHYVVFS